MNKVIREANMPIDPRSKYDQFYLGRAFNDPSNPTTLNPNLDPTEGEIMQRVFLTLKRYPHFDPVQAFEVVASEIPQDPLHNLALHRVSYEYHKQTIAQPQEHAHNSAMA